MTVDDARQPDETGPEVDEPLQSTPGDRPGTNAPRLRGCDVSPDLLLQALGEGLEGGLFAKGDVGAVSEYLGRCAGAGRVAEALRPQRPNSRSSFELQLRL